MGHGGAAQFDVSCDLSLEADWELDFELAYSGAKGMVRSPEHGNVVFGIKYCRNSPENAMYVLG